MKINYIDNIRNEFRSLKERRVIRNGTIEIQNAIFRVDQPTIFGERNEKYIKAELEWYKSQSLNVNDLFDIYGSTVKIWKDVSDKAGYINSNYGWCIYSQENGRQYDMARATLSVDPFSRQACMYYTNPMMHLQATVDGRRDHMCTTHVQYFINNNYLHAEVNMRSNDAIFGFINDLAWQKHVLDELANDLNLQPGPITWHAGSLHIYDRHWDLII